ncbi:MAG: D-alanyl-D-alanine carboxypeptidase family protein [Novosphingobium sp.]
MLAGLAAVAALSATAGDAAPAPPREVAPIPVSLLVDIGSGQVLEERDAERRFLPASMTKVMTAYVAFEEIAAGRLKLDREFTVREETSRMWRRRITSLYLQPERRLDTHTLLHGIATVSANDAAVVLAEGYAGSVPGWSALMNREARKLGMTQSSFATPNGWPDGGLTQVSAHDLVTLASAMIRRHPGLYRHFFGQKEMTYNGVTQKNHDPTLGVVPGADGIKTGHTNEAGFNFLGSAERGGRRLVMVIGGSASGPQRATAARALLEWGFSAWRTRPLFAAGATVARGRVQGGRARSVPLVAAGPVYAAMPIGTTQPVKLTLHYRGPILAPVAKGAPVAELEIDVLGQRPGRVPLYAGRSVSEAGPLDRLLNGLVGLVW